MLLFLHSLFFLLSFSHPCWLLPFSLLCIHLQRLQSKIISIENPPSTNSMVQSTLPLTLNSLVWSLHDVLHVSHLVFPPSSVPLVSSACNFGSLWIYLRCSTRIVFEEIGKCKLLIKIKLNQRIMTIPIAFASNNLVNLKSTSPRWKKYCLKCLTWNPNIILWSL